jgi:hypothetical protein
VKQLRLCKLAILQAHRHMHSLLKIVCNDFINIKREKKKTNS